MADRSSTHANPTAQFFMLLLLSSLAVSCDNAGGGGATAKAPSAEEAFLDTLAHRLPAIITSGNLDVAERVSRLYSDVKDGRTDGYVGKAVPMGAIRTLDHRDGTFSILSYSYFATADAVPSALRLSFGNGQAVDVPLTSDNHRVGDHGFIKEGSVQIDLKEFLDSGVAKVRSVTIVPRHASGGEGEPVSIDLFEPQAATRSSEP